METEIKENIVNLDEQGRDEMLKKYEEIRRNKNEEETNLLTK